MAQLNIYIPDELEKKLRQEAKKNKLSVSAFIVGLFVKSHKKTKWSSSFFDDLGGKWKGEFSDIDRPPAEDEAI